MVKGEVSPPKGSGAFQDYVCGFMFDSQKEHVVLIRKNRPEWQKGKLNGVGGKIEIGESPLEAMSREFLEEAGIYYPYWIRFCRLELSRGGFVYCFVARANLVLSVKTMTDEEVGLYKITNLYELQTMPNVRWIVPMALSFESGEMSSAFDVKEIS